MTDAPYARAAFINAIAEEGSKEEAVKFLQETWNELCKARTRLAEVEGELMLTGQAMHNAQVRAEAYEVRAERAEAALATARRHALEEAAMVVSRRSEQFSDDDSIISRTILQNAAATIRALANEAET